MISILKDHVSDRPNDELPIRINETPLYGLERAMGEDPTLTADGPPLPFRMYDDDGELCYEGILNNDDAAANQIAALRWGEAMAGCTRIKIKVNGQWKEEIG